MVERGVEKSAYEREQEAVRDDKQARRQGEEREKRRGMRGTLASRMRHPLTRMTRVATALFSDSKYLRAAASIVNNE